MPGIAHGAQDRPPGTVTWTPNKDEQADLDAIDTKLQRMRDHITVDPYVITIPQDVEPRYHHHYESQAKQWLYSTPFEDGEHEATQYLTFHYHEPGKEMYMLHNSRPISESSGSQDKPRPSMRTNISNTGPKKKISFSAYKKGKQNGDAVTPELDAQKSVDAAGKQPAVKGPVERVKAETQETLAAVADENEEEQKMQRERSPEHGDLKRKRMEQSEAGRPESRAQHGEAEPSLKKLKVEAQSVETDTPRHQKSTTARSQNKLLNGTRMGESELPPRLSPPRLSPGLPDKLSPLHTAHTTTVLGASAGPADAREQLPARLSLSFPDNITKALEAYNNIRPSSKTSSSNLPTPSTIVKDKNGKLTPLKKTEGITKHKSPIPRNGFRASPSSPAVRSELEAKAAAVASTQRAEIFEHSQDDEIAVAKVPKAKGANKADVEASALVKIAQMPEDLEKSASLVIRLKYGRHRKENVLRILKMRSKPDKSMLLSPSTSEEPKVSTKSIEKPDEERKDESAKLKGVAQKVGPVKKDKKEVAGETPARKPEKTVPKQSGKRPIKLAENPTSPPKRKSDDDRQGPSAKRRKFEAADAHKEPSTPGPREMDSPIVPKSGQLNTPGTRRDFLSHSMKRELSQDSNSTHTPPAAANTPIVNGSTSTSGITRPPSSQPSSKSHRLNAFELEQKRLEDLGRQLKHSATAHLNHSQTGLDQKLAAVKAVESLLCYLLAFACVDEGNACADPKRPPMYRVWCSLNAFYAFVKHTTSAFTPLSGLVCALGIVINARILEISTLVSDPPKQEVLVDTALLLTRAVAGLEEKLDLDTLQETFPRSWKGRTKKIPPNDDKLDPAKLLSGPYKLPIGVATTPVRAARAGHAMLREWMAKEKIDYTLKLKL